MQHRSVICLMGPTASGKTQLAVNLVQHFPLEIISVDSAMVYRGLDIGTAKPDPETLRIAPHHLIDIRDPSDAYSAAQFREDALQAIELIFAKKKIPLLVGGTMLYFRALTQGLSDLPSADHEIRHKILTRAEKEGWPALHAHLATIDPDAALRIHPNDNQRIQRALEVYELTGMNLTSSQQQNSALPAEFSFHYFAIAPQDRKILHDRIALRFKQMLENGFIDEVKALFARDDINLDTPAIRSVGYRQAWEYLQGKLTLDEMQDRGIIATRQLAKRQLTWLRSWPDLTWLDSESPDLYQDMVELLKPLSIQPK